MVEDDTLLKKCNKIWNEIKQIMKRKKIDSDPVFGDKCLRAKIKSYHSKITTNLENVKSNSKEGSKCIFVRQ